MARAAVQRIQSSARGDTLDRASRGVPDPRHRLDRRHPGRLPRPQGPVAPVRRDRKRRARLRLAGGEPEVRGALLAARHAGARPALGRGLRPAAVPPSAAGGLVDGKDLAPGFAGACPGAGLLAGPRVAARRPGAVAARHDARGVRPAGALGAAGRGAGSTGGHDRATHLARRAGGGAGGTRDRVLPDRVPADDAAWRNGLAARLRGDARAGDADQAPRRAGLPGARRRVRTPARPAGCGHGASPPSRGSVFPQP